jgi:hypothetical protein
MLIGRTIGAIDIQLRSQRKFGPSGRGKLFDVSVAAWLLGSKLKYPQGHK